MVNTAKDTPPLKYFIFHRGIDWWHHLLVSKILECLPKRLDSCICSRNFPHLVLLLSSLLRNHNCYILVRGHQQCLSTALQSGRKLGTNELESSVLTLTTLFPGGLSKFCWIPSGCNAIIRYQFSPTWAVDAKQSTTSDRWLQCR